MEAVVGEKSLIGQLGGGDKVHVRCRQDTLLGYTVLGCLRLEIPVPQAAMRTSGLARS